MSTNLTAFFNPKSVALIGASNEPTKVGAIILTNILVSKFPGKIYPVNLSLGNVQNLTCYKNVGEIPETPDLAIIAIPAAANIEVLTQIGEKGIKNVVCIAAGFKESGKEGEKLEDQLLQVAQKYGINLLGPNCLGFVNNLCPINTTFGEMVESSGNLRFITQSGALAASLFDWCKSKNLGFSEFITLGNKAVLNENDILQYFLDHPNTQNNPEGLSKFAPIGLYLESISQGPQFLHLAKQITKNNPIFILKPGKTKAAASAMQSHTGAIAGEDDVLTEALDEAGIIRCESLEDFFDLSQALALENIPSGPKIAIISNAGGPAVVSADAVIENGLELAEFDEQTRKQLEKVLPRAAGIKNPVDVLGDALADRFAQAGEIVLQTSQVDALVVILTPQVMTQIAKTAENLGGLSVKYQKPIFCSFIGGNLVVEGEKKLNELKIPTFKFPERAIAALGKMWWWKKQQTKMETVPNQLLLVKPNLEKIRNILTQAKNNQQKILDNVQASEVAANIGIHTPPASKVESLQEARNFIEKFSYPVVLKLSSPGLLHKKEIGGVITGIGKEEELEIAWDKLERKISQLDTDIQKNTQVQIQKEILNGEEIITGVKSDPTFGPVLLFGAGGTWAELLSDRNLHLLPLEISQAKELVERSKIFPVLNGFRGEPPLALDKIYEALIKLGQFTVATPEIVEIEINPLIVTLNDVWAVDTKVILTSGESKPVAMPQFKVATVLSREVLAGTYHYFTFQTDLPLNFQPGQYISVKVAPQRINCYSITTHEGNNKFSLFIDTKPGGAGSKFFENLKTGEKISYLGPFGQFVLKTDDGAKELLFLGTGCGISPLRAQIEAALKEQNLKIPMTLYLGVTSNKDIFWQDYFQKLSQEYPNFKFKIVVWQPQWGYSGYTGFITDVLKQDLVDASGVAAYLCGNKSMFTDATQILLEKGCPEERIYTEKY